MVISWVVVWMVVQEGRGDIVQIDSLCEQSIWKHDENTKLNPTTTILLLSNLKYSNIT
jgi:hypothetical protein